jgi:hypothetical protein
MLKRKLQTYNISVEKETLGFSSLFAVIVRYPLTVECFYTQVVLPCNFFVRDFKSCDMWSPQVNAFITWARPYMSPSYAINNGCRALDALFRYNITLRRNIHESGRSCSVFSVPEYSTLSWSNKEAEIDEDDTVFNCAVTSQFNDYNLLPYRLHLPADYELCATYNPVNINLRGGEEEAGRASDAVQSNALTTTHCMDFVAFDDHKIQYSLTQLFSVFPATNRLQRVIIFPEQHKEMCLVVRSAPAAAAPVSSFTFASVNQTKVLQFDTCANYPDGDRNLLFAVNWLRMNDSYVEDYFASNLWKSTVARARKEFSGLAKRFRYPIQSIAAAPPVKQHQPNYLLAEIRWAGMGGQYCLSFETVGAAGSALAMNRFIGLDYCKSPYSSSSGHSFVSSGNDPVPNTYFLLERTRIVTPTAY